MDGRIGQAWIRLSSLPLEPREGLQLLRGQFRLAGALVGTSEAVVRLRHVRFDRDRAPQLRHRLGVSVLIGQQDAKLQELKKRLARKPLKDDKRLIFTQYADTATYLHDNLNPGGKRDHID